MTHYIKGSTGDMLFSPSPLVGCTQVSVQGRGEGASLLDNAKRLRSNMTDVEHTLWRELRAKRFANYKFRRQVPMQKYIADFVCYEPKLIVELDGGQHALQTNYDAKRDQFFKQEGFHILRFWNNEVVENLEGVLMIILSALQSTPLPNPSPTGGEGLSTTELTKSGGALCS